MELVACKLRAGGIGRPVFLSAVHACLQAIDVKRELRNYAGDDQYPEAVRSALAEAFEKFQPQLIIYNAGTDILQGE